MGRSELGMAAPALVAAPKGSSERADAAVPACRKCRREREDCDKVFGMMWSNVTPSGVRPVKKIRGLLFAADLSP